MSNRHWAEVTGRERDRPPTVVVFTVQDPRDSVDWSIDTLEAAHPRECDETRRRHPGLSEDAVRRSPGSGTRFPRSITQEEWAYDGLGEVARRGDMAHAGRMNRDLPGRRPTSEVTCWGSEPSPPMDVYRVIPA